MLGQLHTLPAPSLHQHFGDAGSRNARCSRSKANRNLIKRQVTASSNRNGAAPQSVSAHDLDLLQRAAEVADSSAGVTQPHPNAGCVLVSQDGRTIAQTYQRAQGTVSAEAQAVGEARADASGATAYLNLEPGDCHGDDSAVQSLLQSGVSRVVVGLRHPLTHLRGHAIRALQRAGLRVDVLGELGSQSSSADQQKALHACLAVNEALLHRAALSKPLGILKYAMTMDGKIATSSGHAAWISSTTSRNLVFQTRARSDAVVVGGQTLRRDNPRLTTRRDGGHMPARVVMSRTLDLPEDANLWDVSTGAPTIVMTQRGARRDFQARLRDKGVEVVEYAFLTPEAVAEYCYERGFLQVLWECGGTLAAPAISGLAIHKAMCFIAPKLVGGVRAPTPVGELGNVEMTQAQQLLEAEWRGIGPDMLLSGYLPAAGGLWALHQRLADRAAEPPLVLPQGAAQQQPQAEAADSATNGGQPLRVVKRWRSHDRKGLAEFYKSWDRYGALSNFSPHAIEVAAPGAQPGAPLQVWPSVEHYYQAQKLAGSSDPEAAELREAIRAAASPEEAARLGRGAQRWQPHLVQPDWETAKLKVMATALRAKFSQHDGPRAMLLSTAKSDVGPLQLMESSPHDFFWGGGHDGSGENHLGRLLMRLRAELLQEAQDSHSGSSASRRGSVVPAVEVASRLEPPALAH